LLIFSPAAAAGALIGALRCSSESAKRQAVFTSMADSDPRPAAARRPEPGPLGSSASTTSCYAGGLPVDLGLSRSDHWHWQLELEVRVSSCTIVLNSFIAWCCAGVSASSFASVLVVEIPGPDR
jgi:hypothetical protein